MAFKRLTGLLIAGALTSTTLAMAPVQAQETITSAKLTGTQLALHPPADAAPQDKLLLVKHRKRKNLNHIYAFDRIPLSDRTPVILMPGRAEEFQQASWWKKFRKMSLRDPSFEKHFKLYNYIYTSGDPLKTQTEAFVRELKQGFGQLPPDRKVILISYSLGGVIAREALEDNEVYDRTQNVFAIAVPFHGSPMFNPDWFSQYLKPPNHSPVRKFWDIAVYRTYMFGKTNLIDGLQWNNFDASRPMYEDPTIQGDQIQNEYQAFESATNAAEFKKKTIVYASYLPNEHTEEQKEGFNPLSAITKTPRVLPRAVLGSVLPFYGVTVHSVFTYMNRQLANVPTFTPEHPRGKNIRLYRYNDGAIPLTSMLYLPPRDMPYHEDLNLLLQTADVSRVRIFKNIDHMHIGEYSMHRKLIEVSDSIHPEDGKRTPNEWLLYDLNTHFVQARKNPPSDSTHESTSTLE